MGTTNRPIQRGGMEKPKKGEAKTNDGMAAAHGGTPRMEALLKKQATVAASSTSIFGKCTTSTGRQLAHATQTGLSPEGGAQTGGKRAMETLGPYGEDQPSQSGNAVKASVAFGQNIRRLPTAHENYGGDLAEQR